MSLRDFSEFPWLHKSVRMVAGGSYIHTGDYCEAEILLCVSVFIKLVINNFISLNKDELHAPTGGIHL